MRRIAIVPVLLILLLSACQKGSPAADAPVTPTAAAPTSSAPSPLDAAKGAPKTDPCDLLTKGMAEGALGVPVAAATRSTGPGNETCAYAPADGQPNVFVYLTTYAASGADALAEAAKAFRDATPVADLGDAAMVSRQAHAVGVSAGDLLFAVSLLRPDGLSVSPATVEAQVITLARTVLSAR
ncbi:MAG: DUF3558 family protein [Mycobacteriales bacterium]